MTWWEGLLAALGLPALKFALQLLEQKYPGISPIINQVIQYLAANPSSMTAIKLHEHLKTFQVPGPK